VRTAKDPRPRPQACGQTRLAATRRRVDHVCAMRRLAILVLMLTVGVAAPARAAGPWITRSIVLPRNDVALDFGFGLGHAPTGPDTSITGYGLNLELAVGVAHGFELGLRTGFRLDDNGQATRADGYGRPFDTETYGTNNDRVANPELRFRWAVARAAAAELGLELRFYLPTEAGSHFGLMFGLPIALRAGAVRVDTGLYVPVIFTDPQTTTIVSIPIHVWFQATPTLWVGPLFGLKVVSQGGNHSEYPLGFGLGATLSRSVDIKTWFLFPDMNHTAAARTWGAGLALQIRFE
jgi:hypothetical protein